MGFNKENPATATGSWTSTMTSTLTLTYPHVEVDGDVDVDSIVDFEVDRLAIILDENFCFHPGGLRARSTMESTSTSPFRSRSCDNVYVYVYDPGPGSSSLILSTRCKGDASRGPATYGTLPSVSQFMTSALGRSVPETDWRSLRGDTILKLLYGVSRSPFNPNNDPVKMDLLMHATGLDLADVQSLIETMESGGLVEATKDPEGKPIAVRLSDRGREWISFGCG